MPSNTANVLQKCTNATHLEDSRITDSGTSLEINVLGYVVRVSETRIEVGDPDHTGAHIYVDRDAAQAQISAGAGGAVLYMEGGEADLTATTIELNASTESVVVDGAGHAISITAAAGVTINDVLKLNPVAVASLPGSPSFGMIAVVSDSNTVTWGATIAGGGTNKVVAFYNGTNWTVMGK